jgi:hypothetical protein
MHGARNSLDIAVDRGRDKPERIEPICIAMSDKKQALFFVLDFVEKSESLLEPIANVASKEFRLFLGLDDDI